MGHIFFFLSVFLAGILSFFSPCILPLLPVYTGVLLDDKDGAQASSGKFSISVTSLLRTLAFIAGISFIFYFVGLWSWFFRRFALCFLVPISYWGNYYPSWFAPNGDSTL
ncbi:cytochrome c-type biogenesis protein [Streptococcus pneumoniae]|nr:cytochrome c-type biogenesis protein [Streptococcus pneumoniae]